MAGGCSSSVQLTSAAAAGQVKLLGSTPAPPCCTLYLLAHHPFACLLPALGGNLGGVTSALLALDGGALAARLHLDVIIPVRGFKRCLDLENEYGVGSQTMWLLLRLCSACAACMQPDAAPVAQMLACDAAQACCWRTYRCRHSALSTAEPCR